MIAHYDPHEMHGETEIAGDLAAGGALA